MNNRERTNTLTVHFNVDTGGLFIGHTIPERPIGNKFTNLLKADIAALTEALCRTIIWGGIAKAFEPEKIETAVKSYISYRLRAEQADISRLWEDLEITGEFPDHMM